MIIPYPIMPPTGPASSTPLEAAFRKQVNTVREALALFHLLLPSSCSSAFKAALTDLVNSTVCSQVVLVTLLPVANC